MTTQELVEWVLRIHGKNESQLNILQSRYEKALANNEAQTAEKLRKAFNHLVETQELIEALTYNLHDTHRKIDSLSNKVLGMAKTWESISNLEKRRLIHGPFENRNWKE